MWKIRLAALALATLSVGLVATPASASRVVVKLKGKQLSAFVTDCPPGATAGTTCTGFNITAGKERVDDNGTVTRTATLVLEKYELTVQDGTPPFSVTVVGSGTAESGVHMSVATDLSHGSANGVVPVTECDTSGQNCTTTDTAVSMSLTANAPVDYLRGLVVEKIGTCKTTSRFNFRGRTADGQATVDGVTYATSPLEPDASSIGISTGTTIYLDC